MKTLTKQIAGIEVQTLKAAFIVMLGMSLILLTVQAGYYFGLIKAYSWQ